VTPAVIERARHAVVVIAGPNARGLGFVVDSSGFIVTSDRLVSGGRSLAVRLHDGRTLPVRVVARDSLSGVAVLKVDASGLPAIALGSSGSLRVGDPVLALNTGGGAPAEATAGTVSATGTATGGDLATDLPGGPARAGAPLLNAAGEAVGIATGAAGARMAAIPIDRVKPVLLDLRRTAPSPAASGTTFESGR
jgi:serine protease Do